MVRIMIKFQTPTRYTTQRHLKRTTWVYRKAWIALCIIQKKVKYIFVYQLFYYSSSLRYNAEEGIQMQKAGWVE